MNKTKTKKRKSLKGMTLMEIIVSLAVVAVLTTILVGAASAIDAYIKSANHVNKKTSLQAPVAESGYTGSAQEISSTDSDIHITVNNDIKLVGSGWAVNDPSVTDDGVGGNLNMKFVTNVQPDTSEDDETEESETPDE